MRAHIPGLSLVQMAQLERMATTMDAGRTLDGMAPPGWESSAQHLQQDAEIQNPHALAWWLRRRGFVPLTPGNERAFEAAATEAKQYLRHSPLPPEYAAAARGEHWAQAQLLQATAPLYLERRS